MRPEASHRLRRDAVRSYLAACLVGIAASLGVMPVAAMLGIGPGWNPPFPDQAQALAAHLAYQADIWRWPLLDIGTVFWPHAISGALIDFNPLLSLAAKLWTKTTGIGPVNLFGPWMALCWMLQAVAAAYAARGLRLGPAATTAVALLAVCWPALLARMGHLNLCAHFLLLLSLGLVFRGVAAAASPRRWSAWIAPGCVMLVAILVHPYLFQLCAALFAAIPIQAVLARRAGWRSEAILYVLSGVVAAGGFMLLSFVTGGKDSGFVTYSMNLLSPIWPQRSGVFGADLPVIDATGGQYEGFNWLGAGVILLLAVGLGRMAATGGIRWPRLRDPMLGLALVLVGLTLLSLSSRVYAGHVRLLDLGAQPWESLFGTFRAPGRAFWPVGYALMLFGVAAVARLPRPAALLLLAAAAGLQIVDTAPLRGDARSAWATGDTIPVPPLPVGTTLFTVAPFAGCTPDATIKAEQPLMLLAAVRAGARTTNIGLGRPPRWFNCARVESDALELPLAAGESRAFFGATTQAQLRTAQFGPQATCRRVADTVICGRGTRIAEGRDVPPGGPLPLLAAGERWTGAALAALLGVGWRVVDPGGEIWSEGARSTLVFAVAPPAPVTLDITVMGVARPAGGRRVLHVLVGGDTIGSFPLTDGVPTTIAVPILPGDVPGGAGRIAFDIDGDIDPAKYGFSAPVRRAGIKLREVTIRSR
jgi:hypothetical protein